MHFIVKRMSKKVLSVVLALMVLLSAVSVAFSALAGAAEPTAELFAVTSVKPAIPMALDSTISLNNVKVEFAADEFIPGADITWINENEELVYDSEANTLKANAEGTFKIQAKKSDTEIKEVYVFVKMGSLNSIKIFDYDFATSTQEQYDQTWGVANVYDNGKAATNGYKTPAISEQGAHFTSNDFHLVYLKNPATVDLIKDFGQYTVTTDFTPDSLASWSNSFCIAYNVSLNSNYAFENTANSTGAFISAGRFFSTVNQFVFHYYDVPNGWVAYGRYKDVTLDPVEVGKKYDLSLAVNGDNLKLDVTGEGVAGTYEGANAFIANSPNKGSVGFVMCPAGYVKDFEVAITFTDEELELLVPATYFVVSQNRPAIPAKVNAAVPLEKVKVEFADGTTVKGSELTWVNENQELVFNAEDNTFTATAEGTYTVTAKKSDTETREIYVFAKMGSLNSVKIFDYDFSTSTKEQFEQTWGAANVYDNGKATQTSYKNPTFDAEKGVHFNNNDFHLVYLKNPDTVELIKKFGQLTITSDFTPDSLASWSNSFALAYNVSLNSNYTFENTMNSTGAFISAGRFFSTVNQFVFHYFDVPVGYVTYGRYKDVTLDPVEVGKKYDLSLAINGDNLKLDVTGEGVAGTYEGTNAYAANSPNKGSVGFVMCPAGYIKDFEVAITFTDEELGALFSAVKSENLDANVLYLNTGDVFNLASVNFIYNEEYYNGAQFVFSDIPEGLTLENGCITAAAKGSYTLVGKMGELFEIPVAVAVTDKGEVFDNGNYQFSQSNGVITSYTRADDTKAFSQKLVIPDEVDGVNMYEIGPISRDNANTSYITDIEIGKFIEVIRGSAFAAAVNLKNITIPNTITTIGDGAFLGDVSLKDVVLPGSVSSIGNNAFKDCVDLSVTIYNPEAAIGEGAFPAGTTLYGIAGSTAQAYATANGLTFVALDGDDKKAAEDSCAEYIKFVTERPNKVDTTAEFSVGLTVHYDTYWDYYISGVKINDRTCGKIIVPTKAKYIDPATGEKTTVTVWLGNGSLTDAVDKRAIYGVELAEGHEKMGFWNFRDWTNLQSVKLPNTLTHIYQQQFKNCTSLKSIDIPDSVHTIGLDSFAGCTSLEEVNISPNSNLQQLGGNNPNDEVERVFLNTKVKKLVLPVTMDEITKAFTRSVLTVNEIYFYNKDIEFKDTMPDNPWFAKGTKIYGYKGSTAEKIVEQDKSYKDNADPSLAELYQGYEFIELKDEFYATYEGKLDETGKPVVTNEVYYMDKDNKHVLYDKPYYAIKGWVGVGGSVVFPGTATHLGKTVEIYSVKKSYSGQPANGMDRVINLEIGEGIKVIEEEALANTVYMKSVKLPSTLTTIEAKAFNKSGIAGKLEIPESVTEIGQAAFKVTNLTEVVIYNSEAKIAAGVFDNTITMYGYPGSTAETYASNNNIKFVALELPKEEEDNKDDNKQEDTDNKNEGTTGGSSTTTPSDTNNSTPGDTNNSTSGGTNNSTSGDTNNTTGGNTQTGGSSNKTDDDGNKTTTIVKSSPISVGMVVAISLGLLALLIAAVVVVIIIAKKRR